MKKHLLLTLVLSTPAMAQPAADTLFTELVTLRSVSPSAFEAALAFNQARLAKCGDVLALPDYANLPAFQSLHQYFMKTDGVRGDDFEALFEQSKVQIACGAETAGITAQSVNALAVLNRYVNDIATEYAARHQAGEGLDSQLLETIAVSTSGMTPAEILEPMSTLQTHQYGTTGE